MTHRRFTEVLIYTHVDDGIFSQHLNCVELVYIAMVASGRKILLRSYRGNQEYGS